MNIGKLRHRVTIQEATEVQNDYGEPIKTWNDVNTVWASVEPIRGREFVAAAEIHSEVTTRIRMRYRTGMSPKMRVYAGGKYYRIESVLNFEYGPSHRETHLMCREEAI